MLALALLGSLRCLGCGPSDRDIAEARALYVAVPDGFVVRQEPLPGADRAPRLRQDVDLSLAVRREAAAGAAREGLPGITLDVEQVDAKGKSRRQWQVWIDTAGLAPGREIRTGHVLEGVDYAPGDGFRVEVRQNIPAPERVKYREWREPGAASAGSGQTS